MVWVAVSVAVALLLALAAGAEWWVRERGVQRSADGLAAVLEADVELHVVGRPLSWQVARRALPEVVVVADHLPVLEGRATLDRLRVELHDVRLWGRGDDQRITASQGRFHLDLGTEQLLRMVTLPPYLVSLDVVPTGLRLHTLAGVAVDATVRLDADSLLVRPTSSMLRLLPQPSFRLPLPRWPYGARVEGIALHRGVLEAWGALDPAELVVPVQVPWRRWLVPPA